MSKLGEILSLEYGAALSAEYRSGHGFPVFGSNGEVGQHDRALVNEQGIIVGRKGSVGQVSWSVGPFWPIDTAYWVRCRAEDRRWLYWLLSYFPLKRLDTSTGVPGLNRNDLYELSFFRPDPASRDQIAEILDTLDEAIRGTEAVVGKLKAAKQGLLHDLLTRGINAQGDLRPPQTEAPHLYHQTPLGWLPEEWEVVRFVSKIDFPEGQVDPTSSPYTDWPLIAPDHVEGGTGRRIARLTAREQNAISGKYRLEPGDIVYSKIRPYLRKAVLADEPALCSADMYPLRPRLGVDSRFLLGLILGEQFSRFAAAVSMRSGFPKINRAEMAEYWCGWPPGDEQILIAERLTAMDAKQAHEESLLAKLRLQKSGLMEDLLTGRVSVQALV